MITVHEIPIRVRYVETDAMGFVHHSTYLAYFEMGRTELLRVNGISYRQMEDSGTLIVVVEAHIRFRQPARYDDELVLQTQTKRVTAAKIEHEYELRRDGLLLTSGHTVLACVDREGKVMRVPEWLHIDEK